MNYNLKISFKAILSLLAVLLFTVQSSSQSMVKGSGIRYYQGYTVATYRTATAPDISVGTEFAYFIDLNIVCKWDRVNNIWVPTDNVLVASGVPAHVPSTGDPFNYTNKTTGDLYKWNGVAWELAGGGASSMTVSSIAAVSDTATLTPTIGDEFVLQSLDTSGIYSIDRWLIRLGGGGGSVAAGEVTVTPSGNLISTNVQSALEEQQLEVDLIPRKYDNLDFIDRFEKSGLLTDDSIYFRYADDLINVIYRVDDTSGIMFELDHPDDFYRINNVQIVQPEYMSNADSTAGTFTGYPGSSAWATEGGEIFHNFKGTGILFNHFSDNRGGIWRFYLSENDAVVDSVDIDTYIAGVSGRQKTLFSGLDYGDYSIRGVNIADFNPSSTGDNRGWVSAYSTGSVTYRYYYTFVAQGWDTINTHTAKETIKAESSVLEFAFNNIPTGSGTSAEWVPYHGINSTFSIGDSLRVYKDGVKLVEGEENSLYSRGKKIVVKQELKGTHTSQSDSLFTFKYSHSFIQNKVDMIGDFTWADTVDVTGYGFMFPINESWGDTLTTDQNQKVGLNLTDGSNTTLTTTYGTVKTCLAESLTSEYLFTAGINDDYTLRSQDAPPPQFVEHRSGGLVQKWYNQTYTGHTAYPGEKYYSSTSVSVWRE